MQKVLSGAIFASVYRGELRRRALQHEGLRDNYAVM